MKLIKNHLIALLAIFSLAFVNTSCFNDDGDDKNPQYFVEFVTVNASSDGMGWFENAGAKYYPAGLPASIELSKYIGNRAYITYSLSDKTMPGFDKVISLAALNIAITEFGVQYVSTQEEYDALGKEPISLEKNNTHLDSNLPEGFVIPDGYIYMELHMKAEKEYLKVNRVESLVSFKLDDAHNPDIQGYKGIYLKIDNGSLNPIYLTIDKVTN